MFTKVILILIFISSTKMQSYRRAFAGPYIVEWKELGACPPEKRGTNEIFIDTHFSKKNRKMEIVGKATFLIPFSDDLNLNMDFAIQGSNAAWLPNYLNLQFTNACSFFLNYFGEGWVNFLKSMNISAECPQPKGVHVVKGYDINDMVNKNILFKEFIYGRYKTTTQFIKNRKIVGCINIVVELVPTWHKKSKEHTTMRNKNQ